MARPSCLGKWNGRQNFLCSESILKAGEKTIPPRAGHEKSLMRFLARFSNVSHPSIFHTNFLTLVARRCLHPKAQARLLAKLPTFCHPIFYVCFLFKKIPKKPFILFRTGILFQTFLILMINLPKNTLPVSRMISLDFFLLLIHHKKEQKLQKNFYRVFLK